MLDEVPAPIISETAPKFDLAALSVDEIRVPELRKLAVEQAEADARAALWDAKLRDDAKDADAVYERVFEAARAEMLEAQKRAAEAGAKLLAQRTDAAAEAFERAQFAHEVATARVKAINICEAETSRDGEGDERKLGKLGMLGRRGRPRRINQALLTEVTGKYRTITMRTRLNDLFASKGMGVLGVKDPRVRCNPLQDFFLGQPGQNAKYRKGALVELGRIRDTFGKQTASEVANAIYEKYRGSNGRPRTRDIVADLRNARLQWEGRKRSDGQDGLYRKMTRLIADHRKMYPDLSVDDINSAMWRVQNDLSDEAA